MIPLRLKNVDRRILTCIGCILVVSIFLMYRADRYELQKTVPPFEKYHKFQPPINVQQDPTHNKSTIKQIEDVTQLPVPVLNAEISDKKCTPKSNIFFLKTLRCASSTVQNVILRFGHKRNLSFVLPIRGNSLSNQLPFNRGMVSVTPWHKLGYNIFCHHTVFEASEIAAIMPKDTVYVSIIREPAALFQSLYTSFQLDDYYGQTLERFSASLSAGFSKKRHLPADALIKMNTDRANGYLGTNQLAYDFGIAPEDFPNSTAIKEYVSQLETKFGLVMLFEHFDESMILLKELMCWSLEDVAFFSHNLRNHGDERPLAKETVKQLKLLNSVDVYIYGHFKNKFLAKLLGFGHMNMKREIELLRNLNSKLFGICAQGADPVTDLSVATNYFPSDFTNEIEKELYLRVINDGKTALESHAKQGNDPMADKSELWNKTCLDLSITETEFTDLLRIKQMARINNN